LDDRRSIDTYPNPSNGPMELNDSPFSITKAILAFTVYIKLAYNLFIPEHTIHKSF